MTEKILWCQKCGCAQTYYGGGSSFSILCRSCGAVIIQTQSPEDAVRARNVELVAMIERLIWSGQDLLKDANNPVNVTLFNGLVAEYRGEK